MPPIFLSLQALKVLRTAEFAPYVVFIAAPSMSLLAELKTSTNVSRHQIYYGRQWLSSFGLGADPIGSAFRGTAWLTLIR